MAICGAGEIHTRVHEISRRPVRACLYFAHHTIATGVCKTRNTPEHPQNNPGTPRNTPEQPRNTPGTSHNSPEHPRNSKEHSGTPKIVVSGQPAHELTKPKTSEDSQFFIRLLRITLRFPSISRMLGIFSKLLRTAKKPLINRKNISCT